MGKSRIIAVMMMSVVAALMVQSALGQTVHVVGDSLGWVIPGNSGAYDTWAGTRTFTVGDILTFDFTTGAHDVVEVAESSYDACTTTTTIGSTLTTGPANVTLTTAGEHWYICSFGGGRHCTNGQKLDITVVAAAPGPPASPPPPSATPPPPRNSTSPPAHAPTNGPTKSPPATTTPPPPPATKTAPPPPGSSSSVVLGSVFVVTFFSIVIGMFA